jgi:hypothetical protein
MLQNVNSSLLSLEEYYQETINRHLYVEIQNFVQGIILDLYYVYAKKKKSIILYSFASELTIVEFLMSF